MIVSFEWEIQFDLFCKQMSDCCVFVIKVNEWRLPEEEPLIMAKRIKVSLYALH